MAGKLYTVVGGSGFLGRYVVQRLAAHGHRVRVAVRRPNLAEFLKPLGAVGQIQIVQANVRDLPSINRAVEGATGVINLVGLLYSRGPQTFDAVQTKGAATVAQAAATAGVESFVQVSALGADAASESRYARSKAEAETLVRTIMPQATIMRPSIVFGPEDGFFNRFARLAKLLPVMPVIAGDTQFQPVYVGDVADAIVTAIENPETYGGKLFELGGPCTYTFRELLQLILKEIMVDKPLVDIPMSVAKLQAILLGWLPTPPLTTDQLILLQKDNIVSPGALGLAKLDIAATPVEAILPSYLIQYRPKGQFSRKMA